MWAGSLRGWGYWSSYEQYPMARAYQVNASGSGVTEVTGGRAPKKWCIGLAHWLLAAGVGAVTFGACATAPTSTEENTEVLSDVDADAGSLPTCPPVGACPESRCDLLPCSRPIEGKPEAVWVLSDLRPISDNLLHATSADPCSDEAFPADYSTQFNTAQSAQVSIDLLIALGDSSVAEKAIAIHPSDGDATPGSVSLFNVVQSHNNGKLDLSSCAPLNNCDVGVISDALDATRTGQCLDLGTTLERAGANGWHRSGQPRLFPWHPFGLDAFPAPVVIQGLRITKGDLVSGGEGVLCLQYVTGAFTNFWGFQNAWFEGGIDRIFIDARADRFPMYLQFQLVKAYATTLLSVPIEVRFDGNAGILSRECPK